MSFDVDDGNSCMSARLRRSVIRGLLLASLPFLAVAAMAAEQCYDDSRFPGVTNLETTKEGVVAQLGGKFFVGSIFSSMPSTAAIRIAYSEASGWGLAAPQACPEGRCPGRPSMCPDIPYVDISTEEAVALRPELRTATDIGQAPSVCVQHSSEVWFGLGFYEGEGSNGIGGVGRFNPQTKKLEIRHPQVLRDASINAIAHDGKRVWLSTIGKYECTGTPPIHGLLRYRWEEDRLGTFEGKDDGPCGFLVNDLLVRDGRLWVATDLGLSILDLAKWRWRHFVPDPASRPPMRQVGCEDLQRSLIADARAHAREPGGIELRRQLYGAIEKFRPRLLRDFIRSLPETERDGMDLKTLAQGERDFRSLNAELLSRYLPTSPLTADIIKGYAARKDQSSEWRDYLVAVIESSASAKEAVEWAWDSLDSFRGDVLAGSLAVQKLRAEIGEHKRFVDASSLVWIMGDRAIPYLVSFLKEAPPDSDLASDLIEALENASHQILKPDGSGVALPADSDLPGYSDAPSVQLLRAAFGWSRRAPQDKRRLTALWEGWYNSRYSPAASPRREPKAGAKAPLSILSQVREAADKIADQSPYTKPTLLQAVAEAQAATGDVKAASQTVAGIQRGDGDWQRAHALGTIAVARAVSGDYAGAQQTANSIPDDQYYRGFYRVQALTAVAATEAKAGKRGEAQETFRQAVDLASKLSTAKGDYGTPRGSTLKSLAKSEAEAGYTDDAIQTAKLLSDREEADTLVEVGRARARAGDEVGARRATELLAEGDDIANVLLAIARAKIEMGDGKGGLAVLNQARQKGGEIDEIAQAFAEAGDVRSALEVAQGGAKGEPFAAIVKVLYSKGGDLSKLKEVLRVANSLIKPIDSSMSPKDISLEDIAKAQAEAGDATGAHQTADHIEDDYWKGIALSAIAKAEVAKGDTIAAIETASHIKDENEKYEAFEPISRALVKEHDIQGARKLAAAFGPEPYTLHARILAAIAETQAQMGDMDGAHKTASEIQDDCVESVGPVAAEQVKAGDAQGAIEWALAGGPADAAILAGIVQGVKDVMTSPSSRDILRFKFFELSAEKGCY